MNRVAEIYDWLDLQIRKSTDLAGLCEGCGRCCDFDNFDHRLYITAPELMYLAAKLGAKNIKAMKTGRCPYQRSRKCTIYQYRFAGCRIFCCKGNSDFQSSLSEMALEKFKSICTELGMGYWYKDLATALNGFAVNIYQLAEGCCLVGHAS